MMAQENREVVVPVNPNMGTTQQGWGSSVGWITRVSLVKSG